MAEASGFPYPAFDDPLLEGFVVIVDAEDKPLMACAARRLVELYLYAGDAPASVKRRAVELIHSAMASELRKQGYNVAEAFIPPTIAEKFGKRLERTFLWTKNWPSWSIKF